MAEVNSFLLIFGYYYCINIKPNILIIDMNFKSEHTYTRTNYNRYVELIKVYKREEKINELI